MRLARVFPLLLLAACHDPTDPAKERVVGVIDAVGGSPPAIVAPAEVPRNERFVVTVYTRGSSGCTQPDGVSLALAESDLVRIVPYDIVPLPGHADVCLEDYAPLPHPFPLTLSGPGPTRIRVVGRRDSRPQAVLDSAETTVTVVP
jgi:hypothetical protein